MSTFNVVCSKCSKKREKKRKIFTIITASTREIRDDGCSVESHKLNCLFQYNCKQLINCSHMEYLVTYEGRARNCKKKYEALENGKK